MTVSVSRTIAASPDALYELVSDLPQMGRWSPENQGGRWADETTGPTVGARFIGVNDNERGRRWKTTVRVTAADRPSRFAFDVTKGPLAISTWDYTFTGDGTNCQVTETWIDRRSRFLRIVGRLSPSHVADRATHNRAGMEVTLQRLERAAGHD